MKTLPFRHCLAALVAATLLIAPAAQAQTTYSWSSTSNSVLGGSGTWDLALSNWWNGSSAVLWPASGTANIARFAGTAGTVTLGEAVAANQLRFLTNGYILSGAQTLTLNGTTPSILVTNGATATIGNNTALILDGTAGLTKAGLGTLTLNGTAAHTFTGGLNVNGGTLALNFANFGGSTPFNNMIASGNSLSLRGGNLVINGKAGSGNVTAQTFNNTTVNSGLSSILMTNGTSATRVSNDLGQVTFNAGSTLLLSAPSATVVYKVADGGSITLPTTAGTNIFLRAGLMYGTGSGTRWAMAGSNGVLLTSKTSTPLNFASTNGPGDAQLFANINNNNVGINGDFLSYGVILNPSFSTATATIATTKSWTLNGAIGISANNAAIAAAGTGKIIIGSERDFVINLATAGNFTISAPITDNGGGASALTVSSTGSGVTTLSGVNLYTGLTTVNSGALTISTGTINSSSGIVVNGGTLRYNNTSTALTPATTLNGGTLTGVGAVTLGAVTVADNLGATILNNNGAAGAALTTGNLSFNGAASLNLFLNSTNAVLLSGALSTGSAGQVVITPVSNTGLWGTGLTYNLISYTGGSVGGAGAGQFSLGTVAGTTSRQSALLGDTGSAITLTINGDFPYWTGGSNGDWNTTQTGNWKLFTAGTDTIFINGDEVIFNDNATGTTTVNITENVSTASVTFSNSTQNYTIGSSGGFGITSAAALTKNGTGTVTLSSSNTYAGGTAINNGTLRVTNGFAIGDTSVVTLADVAAANLDIFGSETIGALAGGGTTGGNVAIASGQVLTLAGSGSQTFAGALSGDGGLTVAGSVSQTLTGSIGYAGETAINTGATLRIDRADTVTLSSLTGTGTLANIGAGTVTLGSAGTFNGIVSLSNVAGNTFELNGLNQTIGALTGGGATGGGSVGGTVALGTNNLTIRALSNSTFNGYFTGSGDIVINASNAAATVTFGGDNTAKSTNFTGNVQVQAGTLVLGKTTDILGTNSVGLGTQTIFVSNNATARLAYGNAAYVHNQNFVLNGTGADGLGALQALSMNFGNAAIGGIVAETDSLVRVTRDGSDAATRTLQVRNALAGSGDLTLDGGSGSKPGFVQLNVSSAALTLGGNTYNAFSGNLTLTGNVTMIANASNALGDVGTVTVLSGSTATFNSAANQTIGGLAGAGTVNINGNTLTVGAGDASSGFSGVLQNTSGSGKLTKTGTGTFTLSGTTANTYSGATTISNGVLALDKTAGVNAIAGSVEVATGGTLLISANNQIADASAVTLSGGTISRASGVSEVMGALDLTADSFLDFGTGAIGTLEFGTYTPGFKLTINNFLEGNVLKFGSNLTSTINTTSLFTFDNGFTSGWDGTTFTITAIPEPSTVAAALGLAGLMLWPARRRLTALLRRRA